MDFLADNNTCGQIVLSLVSRGNATIAELLRLSEFVPPVFKNEAHNKIDVSKYRELMSDFCYFKCPEYFESVIISKPGLEKLDEEFKENYLQVITRFYLAFQSIHRYIIDLNRFVNDLEAGIFIQQNLESILQNEDGKQLMCEAVYLCGAMLLIVDLKIEGSVREKMLVSYYRYSAAKLSMESNFDEVCKLLRDTGYSLSNYKRPLDYPESFLRRIPLNTKLVTLVMSRLRSDDIYNQLAVYNSPEHRSTALSTQASMIYTVLYFSPETLHGQCTTMREIVDKFFPDNWVISIYMGIIANLCEAWAPYKAASQALGNTLEFSNVKSMAVKFGRQVTKLLPLLQETLKEGVLSAGHVMNCLNDLINAVRNSNVVIRWFMLHTSSNVYTDSSKKCRCLRDQISQECNQERLFQFLILTADFEFKLKEIIKKLLDDRKLLWEQNKKEGIERMNELSIAFSGGTILSKIEKNDNLQVWFLEIGKQIDILDYEDSITAGRKIVHLIRALEEVQEFHQLDSILQVKQFLQDTRIFLHQMLKIFNINEGTLITIQIITDLSYAWNIVNKFTSIMQEGIKNDPSLVIKLRSVFLKLASALDLPLLRINQSNSPDLLSVSQYYSSELVTYIREVLQVIPKTMFALLSQIINLQINQIKEVPTRLDKDRVRDYAQLQERYEVARCTHSISILAEGMLMMKSTLVGIIKIESKHLLEDGIRKELVNGVASALHKHLVFSLKGKRSEIVTILENIGLIMDGYRRSFEYIQDYVNIYSLKIWQSEISRIINYNVEQECNSFLRNKVLDWQSLYQSRTVPIPYFTQIDSSVNFIGRLTREILRITDPKFTVYFDHMHAWYDAKTKEEIANMKLFGKLERSFGPWGLTGIDKLLGFMIAESLKNLVDCIKNILSEKIVMEIILKIEDSANVFLLQRFIAFAHSKLTKCTSQYFEIVGKVGQMQLLRKSISHQLSLLCKFDSKFFSASINNFNKSLLAEIERHYYDPACPAPMDSNPILYETSTYLDLAGLNDPLRKVFISAQEISHFDTLNFVFVMHFFQKLSFSKYDDALSSWRGFDNIDWMPFTVGLVTIFKQYPSRNSINFISVFNKYSKYIINLNQSDLHEVILPLFLETFVKHIHLRKQVDKMYLTSSI